MPLTAKKNLTIKEEIRWQLHMIVRLARNLDSTTPATAVMRDILP